MIVSLDGIQKNLSPETTVAQAVQALLPGRARDILACMHGGVVVELSQALGNISPDPEEEACALTPITFADEEGRRIYERSLRFVMLMAVKRCFPGVRVRVEHSIGYGVYLRLLDLQATEEQVARLEETMRAIVALDLPFTRRHWSREKAIDYFTRIGEDDKVRLLRYRPYDYFNIYECGDQAEYFYGAMLPSTGWVRAFSLKLNAPGLVMQMPAPANPAVPAPFVHRPRHLAAFAQSNAWCDILECTNAADLNDLIKSDRLGEFIRVNEALHDRSLAHIAQTISDRHARAVFVAGPSSSGKTTFANRLAIHLRVLGYKPVLVSLDDFYRDRAELPPAENGLPDLETIDALDLPYLKECLSRLLAGETAYMPRFSFKTAARKETLVPLAVTERQPLIVEGIHGLNPALHEGFDPALLCSVYVSELTCLNLDNHNRIRTTDVRLLRRIVRDFQFRNTLPDQTMSMWPSVRRGEEKWIFPYQEEADIMFNTALHYELPVLKMVAYSLLKRITPDNPNYLMSRRLLKILHYFLPVHDDVLKEIPPLSILREFIGGCTLY